MQRRGEFKADIDRILDGGGEVNIGTRIGLPYRDGDVLRGRALVVGAGANDGVEGVRQRADDLAGLLVDGRADHDNPVLRAMDRLEARERLPDAVRGM